MRYKRVLLKLSGEALGEDNFAGAKRAAAEIKELKDAGLEIAIVNGGGNILRGRDVETLGLERTQADYMGMLGTVINALALQDALKKVGVKAIIQSAVNMPPIANLYSRDIALSALEDGKVV
ncbi:MAG: UMP kinase, partial [Synergistaceae bacterium]|nr:UMP kinase [Synergistaceae bacterium]